MLLLNSQFEILLANLTNPTLLFFLLGIVAGPLAVAIGRALLDIYRLEKTGGTELPAAGKQ